MQDRCAKRVLVAISGASGALYGQRLVAELLHRVERVYLLASEAGRQVVRHELKAAGSGFCLRQALEGEVAEEHRRVLRVLSNDDLFAPIASGSSAPSHMVVVPCSMGTLARIQGGMSSNLIERAADVVLKQQRPLLLCPRESPFNVIHLRNMLALAEMGVSIIPLMPAFYSQPKSLMDMVDFMVGRILEMLGMDHTLYTPWNQRMR